MGICSNWDGKPCELGIRGAEWGPAENEYWRGRVPGPGVRSESFGPLLNVKIFLISGRLRSIVAVFLRLRLGLSCIASVPPFARGAYKSYPGYVSVVKSTTTSERLRFAASNVNVRPLGPPILE